MKDHPWERSEEHQTVFNDLKNSLAINVVTSYFGLCKEMNFLVDASPVGLGDFLRQTDLHGHVYTVA